MNIEKPYLALLSDLSSIQSSVLIKKNGDSLVTRQCSNEQTIFYTLVVDKKCFDFEAEEVGFHSYNEFYSIFKAFDNVEVKQPNPTTLVIGEGRSRIKYGLTPANAVRGKFSETTEPDYEVEFDMPSELLQLIRSRSALISSKYINFHTKEGKLAIRTFDTNNLSNEWNHVIEESDVDVSLDVNFPIEIFHVCPKGSYSVAISSRGLMRSVLKSDIFDLSVFAVGADIDND